MKSEAKKSKKKTVSAAEKRVEEEEIPNLGRLKLSSFLWVALKLCENNKRRKNGFDRGPSCSTPVISWIEIGGNSIQNNTSILIKANPFSARKIAAIFWEFQHFLFPVSVNNMNLDDNDQRVRRNRGRVNKDEGFDQIHHPKLGFDPQRHGSHDHHPPSAGGLRRHIAASLMRRHQSSERNKHALQPLSPASYGSSLELAHPAATPDSSSDLRGRMGESSNNYKTSTELLKALNRIWSLEEQHISNVLLVKGLKTELHHARVRIKELLRDRQSNCHENDQLVKQISEDSSLVRKSKDHERIDVALQSARDELEDERKLRKRSEGLHRKLARELFEVKVSLASSVKEVEKERKSSEVLEELCDEFAKGIIECARQVHTAKQKPDKETKEWTRMIDHDNLILHMSESWLDERTQMKDLETRGIASQKQPVDKLRHEIETFLATRQVVDLKETLLRRCSLESIPEVTTAPQISAFSELHGEEGSKVGPSSYEEHEELILRAKQKGQGQSPHNSPMFDPTECEIGPGITKTSGETSTEINMLQKSDIYDSVQEQRKKGYDLEGHGSNTKTVDELISESLLSEGGSLYPEYEYKEAGSSNNSIRRNASPVRQWMMSMASPDPRISEVSSKGMVVRDNTLKARLQEPKLKARQSRLKILKGSS